MEGGCCERNVLDFFFFLNLLPRSPEPSLYKMFPGYIAANNPNCRTFRSPFFDIMYTQGAYKLRMKMKSCDWLKQIKHIYFLVIDIHDEGKNKMNRSLKVG